jgi:competence ComEA-like helix-hairpin-helix protein
VRALAWFLLSALVAAGPARAAGKAVEGAVNLNTAPPEVLALLPGVGPAKAQSILAYRKRHAFRTVDELVRIKGIGRKMVRRLRPHLAVGGPTTAVALDARAAPPPPPPTPPPPKRPLAPPVCVHAAVRPARAAPRIAMPTHGACPRPP